MSELMKNETTALDYAYSVDKIYENFAQSMSDLSGKKKGKKMAGSLVHWFAGSHVRTETDVICERFITDMESYIETFNLVLEGIDEKEAQEACEVLVEKVSQPVDQRSNSTSCLMKRAMVRMVIPYLNRLSKEKLQMIGERTEKSYAKWNRLPVEKEFLSEIGSLLKK